jgi:Fic family protein
MQTVKPEIPFNELPVLPPDSFRVGSSEIFRASLNALGAISGLRAVLWQDEQNPVRAMQLMKPLFVPEAVKSSNVENIQTTNDEVLRARAEVQDNPVIELKPSAEKEVLNYVDALQEGTQRLARRGFLSVNDIIAIQKKLEPTRPGLRKLPGTHLANPATGKIYYTPPEGERVIRAKLDNFEKFFNEPASTDEVFARMAMLHYQFEAIHPFNDGNGRTGRMLMPLYLVAQHQLDIPVLFISRYILDNRDDYYVKLRKVTYEQQWEDWILFIIQGAELQAKFTSQMLERVKKAMLDMRQTMHDKLPKLDRDELVQFMFSEPYFTMQAFMNAMNVSRPTANAHLNALANAGLVQWQKEEGRNRNMYSNPKYLEVLNAS